MAPPKKSRSVRLLDEVLVNRKDREGGSSSKGKVGRRKFCDKLGPQWSKAELQSFYDAYRTYGKDWKKVGAVLSNRSVEMVEALYNMNRAYLSLPEGTASVIGLVAMMTDHYNVIGGINSDQESDEAAPVPQKTQKRKRGKDQSSNLKADTNQSSSIASKDGCLSFLKLAEPYGTHSRPTKKRTPRVPVSYISNQTDTESLSPPNKKAQKSLEANDVNQVASLGISSPTGSSRRMSIQLAAAQTKHRVAPSHEARSESDIGNKNNIGRGYTRDASPSMDIDGIGTVEVLRKGNKTNKRRVRIDDIVFNHSDDGGEACSGTQGIKSNASKRKVDSDVLNAKTNQTSQSHRRKKNEKTLHGGDLDALHTLADLSSLISTGSLVESESFAQLREERAMLNLDDKSGTPETISTSHIRDEEQTHEAITRVKGASHRKSKLGKQTSKDVKVGAWKKKPKSVVLKKTDASMDSHPSKSQDSEEGGEEVIRSVVKGKRTILSTHFKQQKPVKMSEESSQSTDQERAGTDLAVSAPPVSTLNSVNLPPKQKHRRKTDPQRRLLSERRKLSQETSRSQLNKHYNSQQNRPSILKEKVSSFLSCPLARKWCVYEWFYSAIDYPWFAKREFVDYLFHAGLGHIHCLTRMEWSVVRCSLGKPRRFCEQFLKEERVKLDLYRDSVRKHYDELRNGVREGLPIDLARPLTVGKRVVAIHPETREVHEGKVLTVDNDKCSVMFDRRDLGVLFVKDIDCMPSDPLDCMPETLKRRNFNVNKWSLISKEPQVNGSSNFGSGVFPSTGQPSNTLAKQVETEHANGISAQQATYNTFYSKEREAEIQKVLSVLNGTLDEKPSSAMLVNGRHNTFQGNPFLSGLKPTIPSGLKSPLENSSDSKELGSAIYEIVKSSRSAAHTMMDAVVKVASSVEEGEDVYRSIQEAFDTKDKWQLQPESLSNGSIVRYGVANNEEEQILVEFMTSIAATFRMIQMCTERQYPPADIAQIIELAISSLHPRSQQNLPFYRELQSCMGKVKNQILALVPTLHA